jgi:hypothetical protein
VEDAINIHVDGSIVSDIIAIGGQEFLKIGHRSILLFLSLITRHSIYFKFNISLFGHNLTLRLISICQFG